MSNQGYSLDQRTARREGAQYGIAVTAVVLGAYLLWSWNGVVYVATVFSDRSGPTGPLAISVLQLLIAVGVPAAGLLVAPTSIGRRLAAAGMLVAVVLIWLILAIGRVNGSPLLPRQLLPDLQSAMLSSWAVAVFVTLLGWLIVRERSPLTWPVAVAALIPGLLLVVLLRSNTDPDLIYPLLTIVSTAVGIGAAWLASLLDRAIGRSGGAPAAHSPGGGPPLPGPPSPMPPSPGPPSPPPPPGG